MQIARLSLPALLLLLAIPTQVSHASDGLPALSGEVLREASRKAYSHRELAASNGADPQKPLLMAVRGIVFDVSQSHRFYGPGSPYHVLVGRDASRAVAMMSLDPDLLTDDCDALPDEARARLEHVMQDTYIKKYPVVGYLNGGAFFPDGLCCDDAGCRECSFDTGQLPESE